MTEDEQKYQREYLQNYAYHEAGHAVIAALLRMKPQAAWINGGRDGKRAPLHMTKADAPSTDRERALFILGGLVGESMSPSYCMCLAALHAGKDIGTDLGDIPSSEGTKTLKGLKFLSDAENECHSILSPHRSAVEAVAITLLSELELDKKSLSKLLPKPS